MPELLDVQDLSVDFVTGGRPAPALRDISFTLRPGEILGLVGESGSAKTTLLRTLMRDLPANGVLRSGAVRLGDTDLLAAPRPVLDRLRGRHIAFVHQDTAAAFTPTMRIGEQIAEPLVRHLALSRREALGRAVESLRRCALPDPVRAAGLWPHQLSGGMRQRAMIALALACEPEILLFDEPTSGLDVLIQQDILDLIRDVGRARGGGAVFVTHDIGSVARVADRLGVLYAGELVEFGGTAELLSAASHPYTRALLAARPQLHAQGLPRPIPGGVARGADRFSACVFQCRCPIAMPACAERPVPSAPRPGLRVRCHRAGQPLPPPATTRRPERRADLGSPLLQIEALSVDYAARRTLLRRGDRHRAVEAVSCTVRPGRTLALIGESGSGKTSITRAILRLLAPSGGRILFRGADIADFHGPQLRDYRQRVRMVFQDPAFALNPSHRVGQLVGRSLALRGAAPSAVEREVARILEAVGLGPGDHRRLPADLSGGERQRVALAAAFLGNPDLVVLDEPTSALDVSVQAQIMRLLVELQAGTGASFLLVSHDLAVVRQLADDVVVLRAGRVVEAGATEAVLEQAEAPYTRDLIRAAA